MKKLSIIVLILALILSCSGCSSTAGRLGNVNALAAVTYPEAVGFEDYDVRREIREQNPVEDDFLAALTGFSYETASAILSNTEGNANYSPLSLYFALALAGTGANGETQSQIFDLIGISDNNELSAQCGNLYRLLYTDHKITKLKIANSLWMDNNTVFNDSFVQNAAENFYASSYSVDFTDETTGKAMGQWVSNNTNNTLAPNFQTSAEQILSIINTIYFYDEWTDCYCQ